MLRLAKNNCTSNFICAYLCICFQKESLLSHLWNSRNLRSKNNCASNLSEDIYFSQLDCSQRSSQT